MSGWKGSNRRKELPRNWKQIRMEVRRRSRGQCEWVSPDGVRCRKAAVDVDHWVHRENHAPAFLRDLCRTHHNWKTSQESRAGKVSRRRKGERKRRDDFPGAL